MCNNGERHKNRGKSKIALEKVVVLRRVESDLDGLLCNSSALTRARRSTRKSPRHSSVQPCETRRMRQGE